MLLQVILLIVGLLFILGGANYLVEGSSSIARRSGISEFVIGLTIVGIGTSTPEMVVSFYSALRGNADIAVGNVVGSNIFNTALILGITAMISPLTVAESKMRRDIPMNIVASILLIMMGLNHTIFALGSDRFSRFDGAILVALFIAYIYMSFKNDSENLIPEAVESKRAPAKTYKTGPAIVMVLLGLAALIIGGQFFVDSATTIAEYFHVPNAFIAITLIAGGTSLPELATCIVAAVKGKGQLALGNILGSNISNILLIVGGSALIHPLEIRGITGVDLGMLLLVAVFLHVSNYLFKKRMLDRVEGAILVLMFAGYMTWLITSL